MAPRLTGLTKLTLRDSAERLPRVHLVADPRAAEVDKDRGSRSRADESARSGPSTRLGTVACSARCNMGRRLCSPEPPSCRPGLSSDDAILVTCAYLVASSSPWVLQSLFLAAIGEARDRGARGLEAFSYRYPEGESRVRALSRPQDGLPAGLPGGLRLRGRAHLRADQPLAPRARRPRAGRGRRARESAARRAGRIRRPRAGAVAAALLSSRPLNVVQRR